MARASESMARLDAAEQIAGEALAVVRRRRPQKLRVGE
jgi:hypothetical protein